MTEKNIVVSSGRPMTPTSYGPGIGYGVSIAGPSLPEGHDLAWRKGYESVHKYVNTLRKETERNYATQVVEIPKKIEAEVAIMKLELLTSQQTVSEGLKLVKLEIEELIKQTSKQHDEKMAIALAYDGKDPTPHPIRLIPGFTISDPTAYFQMVSLWAKSYGAAYEAMILEKLKIGFIEQLTNVDAQLKAAVEKERATGSATNLAAEKAAAAKAAADKLAAEKAAAAKAAADKLAAEKAAAAKAAADKLAAEKAAAAKAAADKLAAEKAAAAKAAADKLAAEKAAAAKAAADKLAAENAEKASDQANNVDIEEAILFTTTFYENLTEKYGEKVSAVAKELAESAKGKTMRSSKEALQTFEKYKDTYNGRFRSRDRREVDRALKSLDKELLSKNLAKFSKAFGSVSKIGDLTEVFIELENSIRTGDWKPLLLTLEGIGLGMAGTYLVAAVFGISATTPLGIVVFAVLMAATSAYIDDDLVKKVNKDLFGF